MSSSCAAVRPVSKRLPDSKELWDETNLPMCVVITPGANTCKASKKASTSALRSLASIPKCLNCGAPHPTRQTHFRPMHHTVLLCYLCGQTSSTMLKDQQDARVVEDLDVDAYDQAPAEQASAAADQTLTIPLMPATTYLPEIPSVPAKACPPVWWMVLDATVPTSRKAYWTAVGDALDRALEDIPPHVHVGLIAASSSQLSTWDLTSPVPHVQHYSLTQPQISLCLAPADALHRTHIQAAVRAIADAQPGSLANATTTATATATDAGVDVDVDLGDDLGMALGMTLEVILEFMGSAQHPGQLVDDLEKEDDNNHKKNPQGDDPPHDMALQYAGGKITCLLGNPPLEIATKLLESQPPFGPGGVAGAVCETDAPKWEGTDTPKSEPTDMTPSNLKDYVKPLDPEDQLHTIGSRCATAALGIDLLVVHDGDAEENSLAVRPCYGLPLLRVLADTSGAPGPLLFATVTAVGRERLAHEVLVRSPWQPGTIFGATVRTRISPGFSLEDAPINSVGRAKLQLASFLFAGGISGPAIPADTGGSGVWKMGSCDAHTSLIVDFEADKVVKGVLTVDGMGEVALKPVLQLCVAYTTCIPGETVSEPYQTVRRMAISSVSMPLTDDVEPLLDAIDPEALAVVLYQKLMLVAFQEGLMAVQETAEEWLQSLLVGVYQSAQIEQAKIEELMDQQGKIAATAAAEESSFVGSERLLDMDRGDLDENDVLLGKGHVKVAVMPLLLYSLMQSDALRPTMGSFRPSLDARSAAMSQLSSMIPTTLSKCIAPSLQLWSTKDDECILESVDLNQEAIEATLVEFQEEDGVFFLDSPQQILIYRTDRESGKSKKKTTKKKSGSTSSPSSNTASSVIAGDESLIVLGPRLKAAIAVAAKGYRTIPPIRYETKREAFTRQATQIFSNILLEDHPTASGKQDYPEWKAGIAANIKAELEKSGDLIS